MWLVLLLLLLAPSADAATFAQTSGGTPVTFAPCRALTWRLNLNGAPEAERANVQAAFDRVAAATGFRFVAWPDTAVIPQRKRNAAAQADADVVFAFASPDETDVGLGGHDGYDTLGVGGFSATIGRYALGASVVINRADLADRTAMDLQRIYMHELGHAVGLGHTDEAGNLMTAVAEAGDAAWGPDDLAGLAELGRVAGCSGVPRLGVRPVSTLRLPPAPAGVHLSGRTFSWRPDATGQTAFYTVRFARTRLGADGWGPWRYGKRETALLPGDEHIALPRGWAATERQAVAIVIRAFDQRGYSETTYRTR